MIISGISIRSKFLLATVATLLLLVVLLLVFWDASNRMSAENRMVEARSAILSEMHSLNHSFQNLVLGNELEMVAACLGHVRTLERLVLDLELHEHLEKEGLIAVQTAQVRSTLDRLAGELRIPSDTMDAGWMQVRTDMMVLGGLVDNLDRSLFQWQENRSRHLHLHVVASLAIGIFLIGTILVLFSINLSRAFQKLNAFTSLLRKGRLPAPLDETSGDEFGLTGSHLNAHVAELKKKIAYITALSGEGPVEVYTPGEEDELGNALVVLSDFLTRKGLDEVTRNREDKKQNWISEGVAQMGEVLRSERENIAELSSSIIEKLVTYMNVEMGSLFITGNRDKENPVLELAASYAYDRRKYQNRILEWGVGLPGTCAQEKKRIFLTEVPDGYFEVSSGTGSSKPNCLLLVPMLMDGQVHGIIELATIRLLKPFEIKFVESLSEIIASSLLAAQTNERTSELLKQSQAQAEALKLQENAMLESLNKLEETQAESRKKESEISGILNAINQSTLVAELGLNGRFTSINDRFLLALESHREQVLGKLYTEFAQVDPYSDEYKTFWASLKEGKSISNVEIFKLFSGKQVWVQQTFTPIINSDGNVYKILDIAMDITETRILQEKLETRELEITRSNLDMQTLNEAVNTALIKCELDAEGIIMEVNEKFTEVTGYSRKELLARNYRLFLKESEKEQFEKIWNEVTKEKVYEGVVRRTKPTGEETWLVSTFSPVVDETGVIYKVYFMGFDITEKKLKYQLLEDANQEIERLRNRLKDYET
jgi:PAS domain S-box-containing protein